MKRPWHRSVEIATAALLLVAGAAVVAAPQVFDRVVARVNNDIITEHELLMAAWLESDGRIESPEALKPELKRFLDELIDERLLTQAARETVKDIPEERINNAVEAEIKARQSMFPSAEVFKAELKDRGWDLAGYKKFLREREVRAFTVRSALARRVRMNEEDVRTYEQELRRQGKSTAEYQLRQILIELAPDAPPPAVREAEARALDLLEQARRGVPFEQLAREHSDDPRARATGGALGWMGEKEMQPELLAAVRSLPEGRVSMPLRIGQGLHLFQVVRKQGPREMLFDKRMMEARDEWLIDLRKRAMLKISL